MIGRSGDQRGFTLIELVVVVGIIGILVSIALPVFAASSRQAETKSCQSNQRTIGSAIDMARSNAGAMLTATAGVFDMGGSTWVDTLVPGFIRSVPYCPRDNASYLIDAQGKILGDNSGVSGFKLDHALAPF